MKIALSFCICLLLSTSYSSNAQIFWVENFDGDSISLAASPYSGPNGNWTMSILGYQNFNSNTWYVSCRESGHIAGVCQSYTCGNTPGLGGTLHISHNANDWAASGDMGALYDEEGDWCGLVCSSDRRAESPIINCSGRTGISLHFYYISGNDSDGNLNYAVGSVWYSPDSGTTWSMLAIPPATPLCAPDTSRWADYNVMLPGSANNNPSVKIGFRWSNTDINGNGGISFAIDSISFIAQHSSGIPAINTNANSYWSYQQGSDIIISSAQPVDAPLNVTIYNAAGNLLIKDTWNKGVDTKQYNSSDWATGLYIIKLTDNSNATILKLLKK